MKIHPFTVVPNLPRRLALLRDLAMDVWTTWNWEGTRLFVRLDPDLWEASGKNPLRLLGLLPQARLEEFARDDSFVASLERMAEARKHHLSRKGWFDRSYPEHAGDLVAYFSCEYGLDISLPIYSGGLGILSGDHLKTASDLGLPLVAVGLLYQRHFCRQYLSADGWQQEEYPEIEWTTSPVTLETDAQGRPVEVEVDFAGRPCRIRIWRLLVGRVRLYLLDTSCESNPPEFRHVTAQLYGGDRENRIRQEIVLGIGGIRALKAIGLKPAVCHINEGHSAFLILERIRQAMEERGLGFEEAREAVCGSHVFTTHTPVPAGNERFDPELVRRYLSGMAGQLGLSPDQLLDLGRTPGGNGTPSFCMTTLSLRHSARANGVSRLHGEVSRGMWSHLWPGLPEAEIPIWHVTNGVHGASWISHDLDALYQTYLGPRYSEEPWSPMVWTRVDQIPDAELWRAHQVRRERLVFYARKQLRTSGAHRGATAQELGRADELLNTQALTIGFARRFATYKRAVLLFSDPDRLARLMSDPLRPVQFLFSGKAHPQDQPGKEFIQMISRYARDPRFRNHIVFVEDYDIEGGRYLTQGCDVWLNNPRRPLEASGTSGMKAAMNGVLNLSVLDGWWDEGHLPDAGWAIGHGETYADPAYQDMVESRALYDLLEQEVIPLFYSRDRIDLPRGWIARMKSSIKHLAPRFSSHRMVMEYAEDYYVPGLRKFRTFERDGSAAARNLAAWRSRVRLAWPQVRVLGTSSSANGDLKVGQEFRVQADVHLGPLGPDDVTVEVYAGPLDSAGNIRDGAAVPMTLVDKPSHGKAAFQAMLPCRSSGRHGLAVRVLPRHPDLVHPFDPGIIAWE